MDISRLFPHLRNSTNPASETSGPERTAPASAVQPAGSGADQADRFEVSDEARARQAADAARQAEVESARQALRAQPGLSPERAAAIEQRVAEGFYDRPEVTAETAGRLADAFTGRPS